MRKKKSYGKKIEQGKKDQKYQEAGVCILK